MELVIQNFARKVLAICQKSILFMADIFIVNLLPKKEKREFAIGVTEIANVLFSMSKVVPNCYTVSLGKHPYYNNKYDFFIERDILHYFKMPFLLALLANCTDNFIYISFEGFCSDREIDFKYLKKKGKKIIIIFTGSDIRSKQKMKEFLEEKKWDGYVNYLPQTIDPQTDEQIKKARAHLADKYADVIINAKTDQISYITRKTFPFLYHIDTDALPVVNREKFNNITKLKVVHCPSVPIVKGTSIVRAVIKRLQVEGYNFDYVEAQEIAHPELLKLLNEAHIVLQEFYAFLPGILGIEALYSYTAVLMSADPKIEELPKGADGAWYITRYWEIYDHLKQCLDNPEIVENFAKKGYEYASNNFTLAASRKRFYSYLQTQKTRL